MASLYDYIQPPPRPVTDEERRKREQLMLPIPMGVGTDTGSTPQNFDLPQVAPSPMDPQRARLVNQRQHTRGLQDYDTNPVVNNDRGWKGRLLDIGRQMIVRAGEAYNNSSGDPTQRLLGALGGGIAGGLEGGFNPKVDEERQRLYDIAKSQAREGELEGQIGRDQQRAVLDADINLKQARPILEAEEIAARERAAAANTKADLEKVLLQTRGKDLETQKQMMLETWKTRPAFKKNDPDAAAFMLKAKELGIDHLMMDKDPAADKPVTVNQSDLPDDLFVGAGLMRDDDIKLAARAAIPEEEIRKSLKLSDEAERYLRNIQTQGADGGWAQKYVRPDGTIDEPTVVQDASIGLLEMPNGIRLYASESAARGTQAKLAAKEAELRRGQQSVRGEVERLKIFLKGRSREDSLRAIDLYNRAKETKNKKAVEELFRQLGG